METILIIAIFLVAMYFLIIAIFLIAMYFLGKSF